MDISKLFLHWSSQLISPGKAVREKYSAFKHLLEHDRRGHELLAELEEVYYQNKKVDIKWLEKCYGELSGAVSAMVESLLAMAPASYANLSDYYKKIDSYIRYIFTPPESPRTKPFTLDLREITTVNASLVGGKATNLAVLNNQLQLEVPEGFVITSNGFNFFIEFNKLRPAINARLADLNISSTHELDRAAIELTALIENGRLPPDVESAIHDAVGNLKKKVGNDVRLALRSSGVLEDTPLSFAGQYKTVLNVTEENVLTAYKQVLASKYSPQALFYRIHCGLADDEVPMAVLALRMISAKASGVVTTADTEDRDPGALVVHGVWGLGKTLVGGEITPDIVRLKKQVAPQVLEKRIGRKFMELVAVPEGGNIYREVPEQKQRTFSLSDDDAIRLAQWSMIVEDYFRKPQELEWCMDDTGRLYVLQARPLLFKEEDIDPKKAEPRQLSLPVLMRGGDRAASGIGSGPVFKIFHERDLANIPYGVVLVAENTLPSYVKVMDKLKAVITDRGSVAGHFASVAREFSVPTLVNVNAATSLLEQDREVTVDADRGLVYGGRVEELPKEERSPQQITETPFRSKLKYMIDFISPLRLVDPSSPEFTPEGCRSFHDIIRFVHEKGMREMFSLGGHLEGSKVRGARRLVSEVPLTVFVLDVGEGLKAKAGHLPEIGLDQINSIPLLALWKGLTHTGIDWQQHKHFDWQSFDAVIMAGGVARPNSHAFASYAVIDRYYLNLNMRFGYHFTILDAMCTNQAEDNYLMLRYAGGGGNFRGKFLRIKFLTAILNNLGFTTESKGDLLDANVSHTTLDETRQKLDMLGRLLGATKLMDMVLRDEAMVKRYVAEFLKGRYLFSSEAAGKQKDG